MLHEYRDIITELKVSNARFASIFDKHNDLDQRIMDAEEGRDYVDPVRLETMKKEKLKLKDEAYAIILEYKKEKGL